MSTDPLVPPPHREGGVIAWMVRNRVTPNLIMLLLLVGGLYMATRIKQEVFPDFIVDQVTVTVTYPGASPEEVERGVIVAIESQIRGLDGIKNVYATALEGMGTVTAELLSSADRQKAHQDIKQVVDRITTFPKDTERPIVTLLDHRHEVLSLVLYGDVSELILREQVERVRDRLLQEAGIGQVDLVGGRELRILAEVSQRTLRRHGLTLQEVANRISAASVEVPGGKLETSAGQLLLRVKDRREWARQFARIPIISTPQGAVLRLEDLATVKEGFEDTNRHASYNKKRSMVLEVYRVGDQTPKEVSTATRTVMARMQSELPPGVSWSIERDRTEIYQQRLELLLKNAFFGLVLVLLLLGTFLEFRLAFWVTMGIPTAFLGALLFLPSMGVSINMMSMFAFIIALGIVVDDAIVAGENIYEFRARGAESILAAVRGAREVAVPVAFSILTNIVAFIPLYFMEGDMGKVWRAIPLVVVTVFLISWVESMIILPSHLAHSVRNGRGSIPGRLARGQARIANGLAWFVRRVYSPFLVCALRHRGLTVALALATLALVVGYVASGRIGRILMPRIESDVAVVTATLPFGSSEKRVNDVRDRLVDALQRVAARHGGTRLLRGVSAAVEENRIETVGFLNVPEVRKIATRRVTELWRRELGQLVGLESLRFESERGGPGSHAAITVELSHRDVTVLERAASELAARLAEFPNVKDIDDGYTPGKQQLNFKLTPAGQSLGLTSAEVARQVRNAFYGAEAVRQQRDRNEVRVLVRFPEAERSSEFDVEDMLISSGEGREIPLRQVVTIERGRTYTAINRRNGRRTVTVTADVEPLSKSAQILAELDEDLLPRLKHNNPGLGHSYEGRQAQMRESFKSLLGGFVIALFAIYFLTAVPFKSYLQPLIVMVAIPFGMVGAVLGHALMGYSLSLMSMMGIVALSGVVVNDCLVLLDYTNRLRHAGASVQQAVKQAGARRFRPIILTTLTTFGGLAPMIFETSRQARFMIPMAISLGFGILFATVISLVLVPCFYLTLEDAKDLLHGRATTTGATARLKHEVKDAGR